MNNQYLKKKKIPDLPGVYLFKAGRDILYIGKATSLKDRVKSYFTKDLISTRGPLLVEMVFKAKSLDFIKTDSVLEALILEASLIKKYQPRYNTKEKDNKSFNYVVITKEDFPRILIVREREIFSTAPARGLATPPYLRRGFEGLTAVFGPFPNSTQLKEAIKIIRKIFPFRDRCLPCVNKKAIAGLFTHNVCRPCFNKQIGLCPGVCDNSISKKDYNKIIKNIILFFEGKKKQIIKNLNKEMISFAKGGQYEQAGEVKKRIFALNHIQDVILIGIDHPVHQNGHPSLTKEGKGEFCIEAYDASHLSGTNNVGVMVVMEDGELKKSDYRKFIIRNTKGDDIGALREMLERRLKHTEWPIPDLIVLDGGIAQINVAKDILTGKGSALNLKKGRTLRSQNIVAVTKNSHHKAKAIIGSEEIIKRYKKEILSINNESHRFAISFHRQKRNAIIDR
jgi:excinuclease ABC subunit C